MTEYIAALIIFLLAFAGLAAGLLLKRKGIQGGCCHGSGTTDSCHCDHPREDEHQCHCEGKD